MAKSPSQKDAGVLKGSLKSAYSIISDPVMADNFLTIGQLAAKVEVCSSLGRGLHREGNCDHKAGRAVK